MTSRRKFLNGIGLVPWLFIAWPFSTWSKTRPRADSVLWGGMGFSAKKSEIETKLPYVTRLVNQIGFSKVVGGFTEQLEKRYVGGIAQDPKELLDINSDPFLIFQVAWDFEQVVLTRDADKPEYEHQLSWIYAQAKVIYLDPPREGSSDGDLRILYSVPFRVQASDAHLEKDSSKREEHIAALFPKTIKYFGDEIATKSFREAIIPKKLRVKSVSFSPEADASIKELDIGHIFSKEFLGQAFSTSLAEHGGLSVFPYMLDDSLGALSERFTRYPSISKIIETHSKLNDFDYEFDLTLSRTKRESVASDAATVQYARGFSVIVKLTDSKGKIVFDKKIRLVDTKQLDKKSFDQLKSWDLKYMIQIGIKLFDEFVAGVITEDAKKLTFVGLEPDKDMVAVKALKAALIQCRYVKT